MISEAESFIEREDGSFVDTIVCADAVVCGRLRILVSQYLHKSLRGVLASTFSSTWRRICV